MVQMIATSERYAVIGLGLTGFSAVRYLRGKGRSVVAMDTRTSPPNLEQFRREFPDLPVTAGELDPSLLQSVDTIVVSPGVALAHPALQAAVAKGVKVIGDIQLFLDAVTAPVVAITGSNAKSTVTTLMGEVLQAAGKSVGVAGNIGTPVLDTLMEPQKEIYVLELSSFQLETIANLQAEVACLLNVTEDHMDRYASLAEYHAAKQRVFFGAKKAVVNRDDLLTFPPQRDDLKLTSFGAGAPDLKQFGLIIEAGQTYLAQGLTKLLNLRELKLVGQHNALNVLAVLAIGYQLGLPMATMLDAVKEFPGLPHRCQFIAQVKGVDYINDSKGTNVGATLAAIQGFAAKPGRIILIAGGDGKGADFSALAIVVKQSVALCILLGKDAPVIANALTRAGASYIVVPSLEAAVVQAAEQAKAGDTVLLSPACASLDMFANYQARGECFARAVAGLAA